VLDLAGGAGRHAIGLAKQGWEVTLIDVSGTGVEQARQNAGPLASHIHVVVDDLTHFKAAQTHFEASRETSPGTSFETSGMSFGTSFDISHGVFLSAARDLFRASVGDAAGGTACLQDMNARAGAAADWPDEPRAPCSIRVNFCAWRPASAYCTTAKRWRKSAGAAHSNQPAVVSIDHSERKPGAAPGWYGITVNYQMDGNNVQASYSILVDKLTFGYQ
jgi:hypothetical protein